MKIPGYRVHRKLGKGGMATVFLATQESFERKVALKIIADSAMGGRQEAEAFIREAKIVGGFSHPHIVPVYDVGRVEQFYYLAMDYLQGGDLSSWIKSGLKPEESEHIIIQIAKALHFAHGKGYIHRDVKADNILFREDNSAVLTDFGIAQPLQHSVGEGKRLIVGTPAYMSPEQILGKDIDTRSDLYSLGILFYQMLTRELPYKADSYRELAKLHLGAELPRLPITLKQYQPIINQLLAKQVEQRYDSALALVKALESGVQASTDINALSLKIADLSLEEDHASASSSDTKKGMHIHEDSYRNMGLKKKQRLSCRIISDETQHFSLLFSQFTTKLLAWQSENEKGCGAVELKLEIDPLIEELAQTKVKTLKEEPAFKFLKKLKFESQVITLKA